MSKVVKNNSEALDVQQKYDGKPHGWIQWKGTDVCIDIHCKCGEHFHEDGEFMYNVMCPSCGTKYFLNGHIELIEVTNQEDLYGRDL